MYNKHGRTFIKCDKENIDNFIKAIGNITKIGRKKKKGKNYVLYYDVPCMFDTETTSFYDKVNDRKVAWVYAWMFGINGHTIIGRDINDFVTLLNEISKHFGLDEYNRLVCYIHNMSFDFAFIKKMFKFEEIFVMDLNKPLYALTEYGLEFRCSYLLSGKSLADIGKNLNKYHISKMVGDLDYDLCRTKETVLTKKEIGYCIHDVRVGMAFIQEKLENGEHIATIPYTKTGYVRGYVRKKCYSKKYYSSFNKYIGKLTITDEEYDICKRAFMGGFTHANAYWVNETISGEIGSFDFTSSYPAVMLSEKFPAGKGKKVTIKNKEEFFYYIKNKCCIFDIVFKYLKLKSNVPDAPISESKIWDCDKSGMIVDNGRIRYCKFCKMSVTNVDFIVFSKYYDFEFKVVDMWVYNRDYLPKPIIECVLDFYKAKTELKGLEDDESKKEYALKKEMLNSLYGMIVMDIVRLVYNFDNETGEFTALEGDKEEQINHYNEGRNRTTYYPQGLFITAYARRNLFLGIYEFGNDYIYSDTDSIKAINYKDHLSWIDKYNENITKKIESCLVYRGFPRDAARPKNIKGKEKQLGVWDFENSDNLYTKFKTLGAKRYIVEQLNEDNEKDIFCTVAGISKKSIKKYLKNTGDPFGNFKNGLSIDPEDTGKNTHYYFTDSWENDVIDYTGKKHHVKTDCGIYLENAPWKLSLSEDYSKLLNEIEAIKRSREA